MGVLLFTAALWVLDRELKAYHFLHHLGSISGRSIALSIALTVLSYLIMTFYEALALRYLRHQLPYRRIALASFTGYAFSNNLGPSLDLMRSSHGAPASIMEYLFIKIMLWGKSQGYRWFSLGMAPLSGLEARELAHLWNRMGAFMFQYGESFYNFQGLRHYKEKFYPEWKPKYLA